MKRVTQELDKDLHCHGENCRTLEKCFCTKPLFLLVAEVTWHWRLWWFVHSALVSHSKNISNCSLSILLINTINQYCFTLLSSLWKSHLFIFCKHLFIFWGDHGQDPKPIPGSVLGNMIIPIQSSIYTQTTRSNSAWSVHLLGGGKKPENPEKTHM